jgi:hypothetical protein
MLADNINVALSGEKMPPGLRWVSDARELRERIRKARHFRLDARASTYVAEASMAIADHLDEARELSRAPFPLTWVQIDNVARLKRVEELGVRLSPRANGEVEGEPCTHIGWLIERHQTQLSAHRASYFTEMDQGVFLAPMAFMWDCEGKPSPWPVANMSRDLGVPSADFLLGMRGATCSAVWAGQGWSDPRRTSDFWGALAWEFAGELRHIFGFLVTITHVPIEESETIRLDGDISQPPPVVKGKPVFKLEHRDIVIKLPRHRDITKTITRVCEGMRKKRHDVRGHWRHFYNADGSIRRRTWIKNHERGDESLGRIVRGEHRVQA